ncbi:MAG: hypothetical protein LDL16_07890 [Thiobacillus sp.]|nr:hypothetical protein [Thiobacillus sp.]
MRRFIALIIMLVVPLQFAWAATAGLHGHLEKDAASSGFHIHPDHQQNADPGHNATGGTNNQDHNEDGHHGHYHPVFSFILIESAVVLDMALPGGPILCPPAAFVSHTPPLLDRPPPARA